jgi:N-acetylglucosamine-6-phosphate deacetylase
MRSTIIFKNCFIPKDGSLQHCHVTVKHSRVMRIEIVSAGKEFGKFQCEEKFGKYTSDLYDEVNVNNNFCQRDQHDPTKIATFECAGRIISPGFIDIQLNGAFGVDFSNPNIKKDDVLAVAKKLTRHGVTHFCPTMVSSSRNTYEKVIPLIGGIALMDRSSLLRSSPVTGRASLELGMHLEGPFFAASKRGAHEADCICEAMNDNSFSDIYGTGTKRLYSEAGVSIVTLAPELPGAMNQIKSLSKSNITVSMGHTEAILRDGIAARKCGASLLTHLFNAMRPFHHREPGLLGLLQHTENDEDCSDIYYSIIADGLHSNPTSVKMAYALSKNAVLVTDAMSAMGLGNGEYSLGTEAVTVKNEKAVIRGTDILAGSVASMDSCVRSFKKFTGCSHYEALQAATINPAKVLGWGYKLASVEEGNFANFVLLDDGMNVLRTLVAGCIVYSANDKCPAFIEHIRAGSMLPSKRKELT